MMYKIPMPTGTNGVRLFRLDGQQMALEYQTGTPHLSKMAMDSAFGASRTLSIRRPDIDRIIAAAVRQVDAEDAAMPKAGKARSMDMANQRNAKEYDNDEDTYADPQEVAAKVVAYLKDIISAEDLEAVNGLLMGSESEDVHAGRNQATDRRRTARLAADAARQRPMSAATEDMYEAMFPNAGRLG